MKKMVTLSSTFWLSSPRNGVRKHSINYLTSLIFILGLFFNTAYATGEPTAYIEHNGTTYTYGSSNTSPIMISVCGSGNFQSYMQYNSSAVEYTLFEIADPTNVCVTTTGNNGREIVSILSPFGDTPVSNFSFSYDISAGGAYQDHHLYMMHTGTNDDPNDYQVGSCQTFVSMYIVRVYPSSGTLSASYTVNMNTTTGLPNSFDSPLSGTGTTHTWYVDYVNAPIGYTQLPYGSASISWFQLGLYIDLSQGQCFKLKHVVESVCGSAEYEEEFCFNSCEVSAIFGHTVTLNSNGTATIQLMPDEDANNPSLGNNFTSNWTVTVFGTLYTVNASGQVTIPLPPYSSIVIVDVNYQVQGFTNSGQTYAHCEDEYETSITIDNPGITDCRQLNLQSHTVFSTQGGDLVIDPIVSYTGAIGQVNIPATSIISLTINGVNAMSSLNIPNSSSAIAFLPLSNLADGDEVCIIILFRDCEVRHCYRYTREGQSEDCRKFNLQSQTIFEQLPAAPSSANMIRITPIVTFTGSGGPVTLTCPSIVEVSINNVIYPPSLSTYICQNGGSSLYFNLAGAGLNLVDGDVICAKILHNGCEVTDCYVYSIGKGSGTMIRQPNTKLNPNDAMVKATEAEFNIFWSNETLKIESVEANAVINQLTIMNYSGQIVYKNGPINERQYTMQLSDLSLARGAYIVIINNNTHKKIIVN